MDHIGESISSTRTDRENVELGLKLKIEAKKSLERHHRKVVSSPSSSLLLPEDDSGSGIGINTNRFLKRHHHHHNDAEKEKERRRRKHKEKLKSVYLDPGIQMDTMHGMMIDAGSSGSRMHVYEFEPRTLEGKKEISEAVAGNKLSYPGGNSRWTDRLRPGIASFAEKSDEELLPAVTEYLSPLLEFAKAVLHTKSDQFSEFPIYLKATAGMRMLTHKDRDRVITACRKVLGNSTFKFEREYARVISGEEEAIYGWAGANFVLGNLLQSSEGTGTVSSPKLTHGTVEMGGASSQIAFYQNNEDIMSSLFKLQIGQGKHWNVYAHSFLYFGVNEAWDRLGAKLATSSGVTNSSNIEGSVHNPCLAGGAKLDFDSKIFYVDGHESHLRDEDGRYSSYSTVLRNDNATGDFEKCSEIAQSLVNKEYNGWCNFAHNGDCSANGAYQPPLPQRSESFGEFLAFSNYYSIFDFLGIPDRSNLRTLQNASAHVCSMDETELMEFNAERFDPEDAVKMCFRSAFAFHLLHDGYGFQMNDNITATDVVQGHKVGWALGSMLYEINTLPWVYVHKAEPKQNASMFYGFIALVSICVAMVLIMILNARPHARGRDRSGYEPVVDIQMEPVTSGEFSPLKK